MGRVKPPTVPKIDEKTSDSDKEKLTEAYEKEMDEYAKKESQIRHIIFSTIPEKVTQRIINVRPAEKTWNALCGLFEKQSVIVQADLLAQLHDIRCSEGDDPLETINEVIKKSNDYAAAGGTLRDAETAAILIKAVPKQYHTVIHTVVTAAAENNTEITFEGLAHRLTEAIRLDQSKDKREKDAAAMSSKLKNWKSKSKGDEGDGSKKGDRSKVKCYNCEKLGHIAKDCRAEGGGAHKGKKRHGRGKKASKRKDSSDSESDEFAYSAVATAPAFKASGGANQTRFLDSAASRHFEPNRSNFVTIRTCKPYTIEVADGRFEKATEIGDIRFQCQDGERVRTFKLTDVYYTPWMNNALISLTQLRKAGLYFSNKDDGYGVLTDVKSKREVLRVKEIQNMYPLETWKPGSAKSATAASKPLTVMQAHARLGHISPGVVRKLVREGMAIGISVDLNTPDEDCQSCIEGKQKAATIPKGRLTPRSDAPWDLVWSDVWGPPDVEAKGGYKYYVSFTDDFTRYTRIYLMRAKSEVFEHYCSFAAWVRTHFKVEIKVLHSDRGGEYRSDEFSRYLKKHGTKQSLTAHDTLALNGVAERLNQTLVDHARAMLRASGLPKNMWGYAVYYAVWMKNRLPTRALEKRGKTPFEMLHGTKPDLSKARGFGCKTFVKVKSKSKLDEKSVVARWIGLSEETKGGHLVYWEEKRKVSVERNVRFVDGTAFVGEAEDDVVTTTVPPKASDIENSQEKRAEKAGNDAPAAQPSLSIPSTPTPATTPNTAPNRSATTTLDVFEAPYDPLEDLDQSDDSTLLRRPQRQRKPSAYVRRLIEHSRVAEVRFGAVHEDFSTNREPNFRFGSGSLANLAPNLGERVQAFGSRSVRVRMRSGKHWKLA
jgi:hypothetical protein